MDQKLKHLEFIQAVINRMANTSFLLKGWSITIIAGLFAFSGSETVYDRPILRLALLLTGVFWFLDSFYLWQERLFRDLYDHVRQRPESEIDFSMDTRPFRSQRRWQRSPFSLTLWPFYGFVMVVLTIYVLNRG